jgi:putative NIF3 family GTP cyclohydrolase 1 type 2
MVMDLRKLIESIEKFSPLRLAVPGDFVGIQVGPQDSVVQERTKIRKCVLTRCATPQVIIKATNKGANAIVAYQGILPHPVKALTDGLLDKIRLLIENKMVLYVVHTSWLSAECGINDTLAELLRLVVEESFSVELRGKTFPLGRICIFDRTVEQNMPNDGSNISLSDFVTMVGYRLATNQINYVGSSQSQVKKILLLAGEYGEPNLLRLAKSVGVDTYVTGNISSQVAMLSNELKMNYICVANDPIESIGMSRLMQLLRIDAPEVEFLFIESGSLWKRYDPK